MDTMNKQDDFTALFFEYAHKMMKNSNMHEDTSITPENIFQPAHKANRELLFEIVKKAHLDGSTILGIENILELYDLAKQGKSCLILSEHVSNLDVPSMFVRFYDQGDDRLKEVFEKIIFIAGVKLNENPIVKLYTEMFSRVVIFPIRSLANMTGDDKYKEEIDLAKKINIRSTRKIRELRTQGNIFVMYPAGTRYRPWNPDTKKGIKEATSYINSFDYICCSAINGNNMVPKEHEDMTKEQFEKDVMVFSFGKVQRAKDFIQSVGDFQNIQEKSERENVKQMIVDRVMENIEQLHNEAEKYREKYLNK